MSQFLTRQATIQDLNELVQLFDNYRVYYERDSNRDAVREFLWNRFEHNESILFITINKESGEGVGFTQLYPSFSSVSMQRIWILNDLFVSEAYRGKQVGSRLLDAAKEYAILTKAMRIELSTAHTNETAQRLYEKNGYEVSAAFLNYSLSL
ncbi:N-acetyltransferase [Paenibacillus baekrokdamisoli]|uniref:N-acetyltransferase n=1 Tax=Paenibacillus baekrokdamisoli TaxID=1712516 RepID=A0A3G9IWF1_9BACL|nr:GNAT family N-acetyltransferase [Paenibacillus baekrokdamisoli]MBB3068110.1 GNAT superfamily N-acetyltransferase [Paenibacillus baekrokdamisoli]BBH22846.1 N-acetyltransferase [Paenibacillus baekrokdamisoli]